MKKALLIPILLLVCASLVFAGCARSSDHAEPASPEGEFYADSGSVFEHINGTNAKTDSTFAPSSDTDAGNVPDAAAGRKLIKDANLEVETLEFDKLMEGLTESMRSLGGYIESNNMGVSGKYYHDSGTAPLKHATMVIRIPAENLDEFLGAVEGLGNITSRTEKVKDVTDAYVDTEARLASLRTEYDTLLGLLEKAGSLEDIITIQDRLTEVRYSIESYERTIRTYDSLIAYSTVTLDINEVMRVTQVEEETFGQEVSRRFHESLEDVGEGFKDFAAWLIGDLPSILVWLVFLVGLPLLIVLIIVKSVKKKNARRAKKAAEQAEKTA